MSEVTINQCGSCIVSLCFSSHFHSLELDKLRILSKVVQRSRLSLLQSHYQRHPVQLLQLLDQQMSAEFKLDYQTAESLDITFLVQPASMM